MFNSPHKAARNIEPLIRHNALQHGLQEPEWSSGGCLGVLEALYDAEGVVGFVVVGGDAADSGGGLLGINSSLAKIIGH